MELTWTAVFLPGPGAGTLDSSTNLAPPPGSTPGSNSWDHSNKAQLQNLKTQTLSDQGAVIAPSVAIAAPPIMEQLVNIRTFYPTVREHNFNSIRSTYPIGREHIIK